MQIFRVFLAHPVVMYMSEKILKSFNNFLCYKLTNCIAICALSGLRETKGMQFVESLKYSEFKTSVQVCVRLTYYRAQCPDMFPRPTTGSVSFIAQGPFYPETETLKLMASFSKSYLYQCTSYVRTTVLPK
jgi:hypothetical protein